MVVDGVDLVGIMTSIDVCRAFGSLVAKLREAEGCRRKMIATDGVFSMDGDVAPLKEICRLAEQYGYLGYYSARRAVHRYHGPDAHVMLPQPFAA